LALSCWQSALCAWHASKLGWPIWNPALNNSVNFQAAKNSPDFQGALWQEIQSRWLKFSAGIHQYHAHPFARTQNNFPVLWQQGSTRLYDYGNGTGAPLLVIPSLVNRAYILDLLPEKSFLKFLSARGFRPLLIDWDAPTTAEADFGLGDYVTQRLSPAYNFILATYHAPPAVVGYCMGGNLALALAQLVETKPPALALLATPWDFHAAGMPKFTSAMSDQLMQIVKQKHELPVDWLQSFFAALDPFGAVQKFIKFAEMNADSDSAKLFVALEDWLSDGVPLTPKVARDTMQGWYAQNTPMHGGWRVGDAVINPGTLGVPTLAVLPQQDRIVSPASAAALASLIPGALSLTPDMGHIGMMIGGAAEAKVWEPLAAWLASKTGK
jgi:polyhydroxyalkanoate synthase